MHRRKKKQVIFAVPCHINSVSLNFLEFVRKISKWRHIFNYKPPRTLWLHSKDQHRLSYKCICWVVKILFFTKLRNLKCHTPHTQALTSWLMLCRVLFAGPLCLWHARPWVSVLVRVVYCFATACFVVYTSGGLTKTSNNNNNNKEQITKCNIEKCIELLSANVKNNKSLMTRFRGQTGRMSNIRVDWHMHTLINICILGMCLQSIFCCFYLT